ncbi:MAG: hypothetical protein IM638_17985, partial [Bacteroidetes bacterium]|nr:hypothetical protein [Bacteroidota bacterium]
LNGDPKQIITLRRDEGRDWFVQRSTEDARKKNKLMDAEILERVPERYRTTVQSNIDWTIVKEYYLYVQKVTGREIHPKQQRELIDALKRRKYSKLDDDAAIIHRMEFNKKKNTLIEEWEKQTNQSWPTYSTPVYSKSGKVLRKTGDKYDAHHLIESQYGGENEWWNIHPAKFPDEHQGGIHGVNSPSKKLFK